MTPDRRVRLRREAWGFAIGSVFFALGAVPFYAEAVGPVLTNVTFFIGAIFFTLAAFIQLALSGRRPPRRGSNRADRADVLGLVAAPAFHARRAGGAAAVHARLRAVARAVRAGGRHADVARADAARAVLGYVAGRAIRARLARGPTAVPSLP